MQFEKKTFSNGLRAIVAPMTGTETVTVLVLVGAGANYETPKTNGLSHFLEHMFFKGTKNYPKTGELERMLDAIGSVHNAYTSRDRTGYWIKADAKHFPMALTFVSEILQNALLREEEIDRERGVILEEMNMRRDDPMGQVGELFEELVYGDNSYGWQIVGTEKTIKSLRRGTFMRYWKSQYVASNTVVIIAGNVSAGPVFSKIEHAFRNLRAGKFLKAPEPKKVVAGPRLRIDPKETAQSHIVLGASGFPLHHKDRLTADILSTILGGYMSSRLFVDIRERLGLAYAVHAAHSAYSRVGYFEAYAGVPHQKAEQVVERILLNLDKIKKSGVTTEELTRAKDNTKGHLALYLESTDRVAAFLGEQELLLRRIQKPEDIERKIDKITKDDIRRVARTLFRRDNFYLALIGPHPKKESYAKILHTF